MTNNAPRRLRRAEAVLLKRTSRLVLVSERCVDAHNLAAMLRTADLMGIQHVYVIAQDDEISQQHRSTVSSGANCWIDVHHYSTTRKCLSDLRNAGYTIWATDLDSGASAVTPNFVAELPSKLAIVMGRETDGISDEMRKGADQLVFLPMYGFTESFNLGVATALILQRLIDTDPTIIGAMEKSERCTLRKKWYAQLGGLGWESIYSEWLENPPPPLDDVRPTAESRAPRMKKKLAKRLNIKTKRDAT
ncbi:MAG: RNA methyltransferase [Planctomycetes bacterium]|nr:RNA methyltransferase [Planctomycetota bacterium]